MDRQAHRSARVILSVSLAVLLAGGTFLQSAIANTERAIALPVASSSYTPLATQSPTATPTGNPGYSDSVDLSFPSQVARGCAFDSGALETTSVLGKCRVLVVGDSLGSNLGGGMSEQLSATPGLKLFVRTKASTGLTKPSYYNWPKTLPGLLTKYRPHLVVVMLGANDWQDRRNSGDRGNSAWRQAYKKDIRTITELATDSGAYVLWVGLPVMRLPRYGQGMATLNSLYESVLSQEPGATFLPTWDFFADANGAFRDHVLVNGRNTKVRGSDGIHFTTLGQGVLATYVIKNLRLTYSVDFKIRAAKRVTG